MKNIIPINMRAPFFLFGQWIAIEKHFLDYTVHLLDACSVFLREADWTGSNLFVAYPLSYSYNFISVTFFSSGH